MCANVELNTIKRHAKENEISNVLSFSSFFPGNLWFHLSSLLWKYYPFHDNSPSKHDLYHKLSSFMVNRFSSWTKNMNVKWPYFQWLYSWHHPELFDKKISIRFWITSPWHFDIKLITKLQYLHEFAKVYSWTTEGQRVHLMTPYRIMSFVFRTKIQSYSSDWIKGINGILFKSKQVKIKRKFCSSINDNGVDNDSGSTDTTTIITKQWSMRI